MKTKFRAYFNLTEPEYKALWEKAFFSFDTNVLLDLYRYKKSTANTFISLVQKLRSKNPVWLPYQVAKEFFRNRVDVIRSQRHAYAKTTDYLGKIVTQFTAEFPRHPFLPNDQYAGKLQNTINDIVADIANLERTHTDTADTNKDETLKQLLAIFEGSIGERPTEDAFQKVLDQCKKRAERGQPPTTSKSKDAQKEGDDKYSDAVIWLELLEYAKANKRPLILVTSEKKEDWWYKLQGEIVGPRRELIDEMIQTANQHFHLYSLDQFIAYGRSFFGDTPSPEAIEDVKAVAKQETIISLPAPGYGTLLNLATTLRDEFAKINIYNRIPMYYTVRTFADLVERSLVENPLPFIDDQRQADMHVRTLRIYCDKLPPSDNSLEENRNREVINANNQIIKTAISGLIAIGSKATIVNYPVG